MDGIMTSQPNNLEAFWMPFTANRQFKKAPRMLVSAEGMYYTAQDGRKILDGAAGLWCVNAGHRRPKIVEAVQRQVFELDYAPAFQMGHPAAFELASPPDQPDAGRSRPRLLHQLGLRIGRYRAEDRARLSARARRGHPPAADRPRDAAITASASAASRSAASSPTASSSAAC